MNVSSPASPRKFSRIVAALATLTMLGAGCGQQQAPAQLDPKALEADSLHMARLYAQWDQEVRAQGGNSGAKGRGEMPIDLADDAQYRFLKNRLLASGSSPENSPQLFQRIEKLRKEKKAAIPGKMSRKDMITSTTVSGARENPWCGHLLPLSDVEGSDAEKARFQTFGLVTCFNGSDYSFADVTAYATNATRSEFRKLGTQSLEDYAGAVLETPKLDLNLKASPEETLVVDSVALAFNEATGESHLSYAVAESSIVALGYQPGDPDINTIYSQHPRELIGSHYQDNPIRTCLERGGITGYLDCDYTSGNYDAATGVFKPFAKPFTGVSAVDPEASKPPAGAWVNKRGDYWAPTGGYDATRLYVPMRGEYRVKLPNYCRLDSIESDASIILLQSGGRCTAGNRPGTAVLSGSLPFKGAYPDSYYRTHQVVPYDGLADFGKDCLDHLQNVSLYMRATLKGTCYPIIGMAPANPTPYIRSRFHSIQNLDYRNACLAEGTKVTKADGQPVTVEQVKVGDKLLANGNGLALTVTTVSRGGERKPMVKLVDDQGGEVLVTETHPMVTAKRGVVQASELKAGDALLTRTGATKLVGVERVAYTGDVFNFALGTPEELAKAGPQARTLFANGFLVGDSHLQSELEKARKLDAREVLSKLNGAWHEDYRREQARKKTAQR
jgi:hypothetical protein